MALVKQEHFGIARKIVANMTLESWTDIPHFSLVHELDATDFLEELKKLNEGVTDKTKRITLNTAMLKVICEGGVRYSVPVRICPDHLADDAMVTLRFRVANVYKNKKIVVYVGDEVIFSRKRPVLAPGEMETVLLKAKALKAHRDIDHITVTLEEA